MTATPDPQDRFRGCFLGLAVGDALGAAVEFQPRGSFEPLKTSSFSEAALLAANLGDDADTTAAVCGQVAGAFYGMSGIPARWLERLHMRDKIVELAARLCESRDAA